MILISNYQWFFSIFILVNIFIFFLYIFLAKKNNIIDKSRKFNNPLTPTSGGIVIYLNFLFFFIFSFFYKENLLVNLPNNYIITFLSLTVLLIISLIDDSKPIDPKIRLFFQLVCVYFSLTSITITEIQLPLKLSILFALISWVYIINIINFTDGADGFLAINIVFLFLNIIFLDHILDLNLFSKYISLALLPSILSFVLFNKPVAKLYLGDTGSVFLGFISGFLFLEILIAGQLSVAISLLIYPITDCSLALCRKIIKGKLPWADTSNYSFLQPIIRKNENKKFIFYTNIIFNIMNSLIIFLQLLWGWYYIFLNFLLTLIIINIYEKKK
jgi:UDP-N-acetylmuramyl pentapeptide phosphotransferase/UDP-N-acetylglucosamine-1-phosphate transferase